jgi:hypothetical protein
MNANILVTVRPGKINRETFRRFPSFSGGSTFLYIHRGALYRALSAFLELANKNRSVWPRKILSGRFQPYRVCDSR